MQHIIDKIIILINTKEKSKKLDTNNKINPKNALAEASKLVSMVNKSPDVIKGAIILGVIDSAARSLANHSHEKLAYHSYESKISYE